MEKLFNVIDKNGNEFQASFEEAKEKGYTVLVSSINELADYLDDETSLSINFKGENYIEPEDVYPDDPSEGDEGFEDKSM